MEDTERSALVDPPVAVVLPTLNGAEFIAEQLDALFAQECDTSWHLVVVDGGSTDGTLEVVESYRPTPVPMEIVNLSGGPGVNAGINAGVAATESPFILIAEHDDVVAPGWMQALVDALHEHAIVGSQMDLLLLNDAEVVSSRRRFSEDVVCEDVAVSTGLGFRRRLWAELGGFDESYRYGGNDIEFSLRAQAAGHTPSNASGAVVHYRVRADPGSAFRQSRAYGVATVRLYRQFGPEYFHRRSLRQVAKEVARLGWWSVRAITDYSYRMRLAFRGGLQLGYLKGSIRYHRWFP